MMLLKTFWGFIHWHLAKSSLKNYYLQYGFLELPDNPLELFLPMATIREAFEA